MYTRKQTHKQINTDKHTPTNKQTNTLTETNNHTTNTDKHKQIHTNKTQNQNKHKHKKHAFQQLKKGFGNGNVACLVERIHLAVVISRATEYEP